MARIGRLAFLAIAVLFHVVYIYSIFDVYFVSPIVSGMKAFKVDAVKAPAKRLVLYVGDGLRADKAFQFFPDPSPSAPIDDPAAQVPRPLAPFLRSRVLEHGTFGVSHTRVPTESRPGHVALIAGLYEDVSAVTTGWKLNPVNFDSVFNRSSHTWCWGSYDILPMFAEGAVPGRVEDYTYPPDMEDFSMDATLLDIWVFDRVKQMFKDAETDPVLNARLREEKIVFFLHLLGLDTTGHGKRPYSREYLHNIQVVDQGVQEITEIMDRFYGDDETAYVFTADHGMSDWGSHGDGHPNNTRTPLITWGAGVAKPVTFQGATAPGHDELSSDWHLDHVQRHDVGQADVATLMAYLAGLEFPVNSVGKLPLTYLASDDQEKAKAMYVNAQQILEMYHVKEEQKSATVLQYRPYPGFADAEHSVEHRLETIEKALQAGQYARSIQLSNELIDVGLEGLRYLQTYDWLFLRALVTLGYIGWVAFAFTTAIDMHVLDGKVEASRSTASMSVFGAILVGLFSFLFIQSSPITYYAYAIFPVMFWEEVFVRRQALVQATNKLMSHSSNSDAAKLALKVVAYIALLEVMVQSYYHREVYTYCYLGLSVWPALYGWRFWQDNWTLCLTWTLGCLAMSVFTVIPALKTEDASLIMLGGFLILIIGALYIAFEKSLLVPAAQAKEGLGSAKADTLSRSILGVQVGLIALAMLVTRSSVASLQTKQGLPLGTQAVGWITLVASLVVPFLHALSPRDHYLHRLVIIFLAFGPLFIILTISYEGLFYFAIAVTLVSWVRLEHRIHQAFSPRSSSSTPPSDLTTPLAPAANAAAQRDSALATPTTAYRTLTLSDARISLFFLYLLQSAFFSTGNIASVSSFSLDAVNRLLPVFDPFSQGSLLLLKILAPFALVSANLGILTRRLKLRGGSLFAVVMGIGDYLTLRFFWEVRDYGSWLDIGESISMFVIASALCIFVAALEALSEVLIRGVAFEDVPVAMSGRKGKGREVNGGLNGHAKSGKKAV
ncbi:Phosphatidylinositolglycan class N-domain-containing protein [Neohortaea acidophila]|uniref:GPI ethanolamine phosphate transferase 1 n=1 Tax=Neohortaea acidophila TaxID=245834 RepID=A0A6A6PZ20_9PEZI|nr:Phosphatidylinositolglycan class N-domain-containing protein [Neohortaea acidophila]KAF2484984.1 Phosphatidylinositolglycan class N-domain-containing protein [Neohortaea acidophila]